MDKVVIASNNKGKITELKQILADKFELLSLADIGLKIDVEETGETFFDNALIKAKAVYDECGVWAISDDSGLCVDALKGAPGVYSARYSGATEDTDKKNNALLLKNLKGVTDRAAHFACSIVLYMGRGGFLSGYGETDGEILQKEEGTGGFGYDPLFYSYELKKSFGVASADEKNQISHRRRAINNLVTKLD